MITENHELITARYIESSRKTVEALWQDPDTNEITSEIIAVDKNDASWNYLLDFISVENIHQNTKAHLKEQREGFITLVKDIAKEEGLLISKSKESQSMFFNEFNEYLFNAEQDKEFLFKLKLAAFELDFVKEYNGRKLKADLRKADNAIGVYKILFEIKDAVDKE
jgi:hypothetical protein